MYVMSSTTLCGCYSLETALCPGTKYRTLPMNQNVYGGKQAKNCECCLWLFAIFQCHHHHHHHPLCHKSSFNPCCNVHGFFLVKTSYVSLIYKCRIVLKIFTSPFLSYTLLHVPQKGEISNISNRQTKSAWKYIITLLILLSQPYTPQETNIYKAGMLLCTGLVCIL